MHQVRIVDGPLLQSVLARVLDLKGTHRQAAEALGIGHTTFTKLLNGTTSKYITLNTYQSIHGGLRRSIPLLAPDERLRRSRDPGWQDPNFELEHDFDLSVLTAGAWFTKHQYERWLHEEYERLSPLLTIFSDLWEYEDYRELFEKFNIRFTGRPELPPQRQQIVRIALLYAIEPLGRAEETWGMNRTWQEIHEKGQLRAFLWHSLHRERIMLEREHGLERLNLCQPPSEWLDRLAKDTAVSQV